MREKKKKKQYQGERFCDTKSGVRKLHKHAGPMIEHFLTAGFSLESFQNEHSTKYGKTVAIWQQYSL